MICPKCGNKDRFSINQSAYRSLIVDSEGFIIDGEEWILQDACDDVTYCSVCNERIDEEEEDDED
jgi:hypothetical protein